MELIHERVRPEEVPGVVRQLEADLDRRARKALMIYVPILVVAVALCAPSGFLSVIIAVGASLWFFAARSTRERAREKVHFLRDLFELLKDELHQRAHLIIDFDLRHYDEKSKLTWSGRSTHGNAKYKYSDKWLVLRCMLGDGTGLEVVRQAGIKTKKGSVVKEKRRLFVSLRPNPRRYPMLGFARDGDEAHRLRSGLKTSCREFTNDPEEFHAQVAATGETLDVKVVQEDAPIRAAEVLAVLDKALRFLDSLRPPQTKKAG